MFVNEDIPEDYIYLAEINDNFFVLVKENKIYSNNSYDAYIQYLQPSTDYKLLENYQPKFLNANYISYDLDHVLSGDGIITSLYSQNCYEIERDSSFYSRIDFLDISFGVLFLLLGVAFVVNCMTSIVQKGGFFNVSN